MKTALRSGRAQTWAAAAAALGAWLTVMPGAILTLALTFSEKFDQELTTEYSFIFAAGWTTLIASLFIGGLLVDAMRKRDGGNRVLIIGAAVAMVLISPWLTGATTPMALAFWWCLAQIPAGFIVVVANAEAGLRAVQDPGSNASGIVGASALVSLAVGTAFVSIAGADSEYVFIGPAIVGLLLCLPLIMTIQKDASGISATQTKNRGVPRFIVAASLVSFATSTISTYIVPYTEHYVDSGNNAEFLSVSAAMISATLSLIFTVIGGHLSITLKRISLIFNVGASCVAVALVISVVARNAPVMFLAASLMGIGFGLANGVEINAVTRLAAHSTQLATNMGALAAATTLPYVITPTLGLILTVHLKELTVLLLFILGALGSLVAILLFRNFTELPPTEKLTSTLLSLRWPKSPGRG